MVRQNVFLGKREFFQYDAVGTQGLPSVSRELPFLESLLSFLETDCEELTPTLRQHQRHDRLLPAQLRGAERHRAALQELRTLVPSDRAGQRGILRAPGCLGQRTCREAGAFQQWTKKQSDDPVFKAYRKEYKRRFAWIKAGRISDTDFYAWSEKAREMKKKCDREIITLEEYVDWLKHS